VPEVPEVQRAAMMDMVVAAVAVGAGEIPRLRDAARNTDQVVHRKVDDPRYSEEECRRH
jgi:hypothetical protein